MGEEWECGIWGETWECGIWGQNMGSERLAIFFFFEKLHPVICREEWGF